MLKSKKLRGLLIISLLLVLLCPGSLFAQSVKQKNILTILEKHATSTLSKLNEKTKKDLSAAMKKGACAGFTTMWLSDQLPNKNTDTPQKFTSFIKSIFNWNENMDVKASSELDNFIEKLLYFQVNNGALDRVLQNSTASKIKKEYAISSLFTRDQLVQQLKIKNFIQDDTLIFISSHNHATGLIKHEENYHYFDPNSSTGEIIITSAEDLADYIFAAYLFTKDKPSPLGFQIFSFDKEALPYPEQKQILDNLGVSLTPVEEYADNVSGLMMAAKNGDTKSLQYFLEHGVDPNISDSITGYTAIFVAAELNHPDCITILLQNEKTNPNIQSFTGITALMKAASLNHPECITALLQSEKTDPNIREKSHAGLTALTLATIGNYPECITALLQSAKTDPNRTSGRENTALELAVSLKHLACVKALTQNNSDMLNKALILANRANYNECITVLLQNDNTNPNTIDEYGNSPLTDAVTFNRYETVKTLLQSNKIDVNMLLNRNATKLLLTRVEKCDADMLEVDNNTLLMLASYLGYTETVEALLNNTNIDPNLKNAAGDTALMLAVRGGCLECVKLLQQHNGNGKVSSPYNSQ